MFTLGHRRQQQGQPPAVRADRRPNQRGHSPGEAKAGDPLPSIRSLAKALHISILTVQKAYDTLQEEGFIETTAGKGCYVAPQNQDFYLEEQQKKIEEKFAEAITIARASGISLEKLTDLLSLMYEEDE